MIEAVNAYMLNLVVQLCIAWASCLTLKAVWPEIISIVVSEYGRAGHTAALVLIAAASAGLY